MHHHFYVTKSKFEYTIIFTSEFCATYFFMMLISILLLPLKELSSSFLVGKFWWMLSVFLWEYLSLSISGGQFYWVQNYCLGRFSFLVIFLICHPIFSWPEISVGKSAHSLMGELLGVLWHSFYSPVLGRVAIITLNPLSVFLTLFFSSGICRWRYCFFWLCPINPMVFITFSFFFFLLLWQDNVKYLVFWLTGLFFLAVESLYWIIQLSHCISPKTSVFCFYVFSLLNLFCSCIAFLNFV